MYKRLTLRGITLEDFEYLFNVKKKANESRESAVFRSARENIGKRILNKTEQERVSLQFKRK